MAMIRYTIVLSVFLTGTSFAQDQVKKDPSVQEKTNFAARPLTVIPQSLAKESIGDSAIPDILRRKNYCFEFSFLTPRSVYVDIQADGQKRQSLVWYLVYRIRWPDNEARPHVSRRFFPLFVMRRHPTGKKYLDRIVPEAKKAVSNQESITASLYDSIEMPRQKIEPASDIDSNGVWGIATWLDVDESLDFVSIDVHGLSNQRGTAEKGQGKQSKLLQLNFYRQQNNGPLRLGTPEVNDQSQQAFLLEEYGHDDLLDYVWKSSD